MSSSYLESNCPLNTCTSLYLSPLGEENLPGTSVEAKRNQAQRRNDFLEAQEEQRLLDEELIENGRPPSLTQQELKIQEEARFLGSVFTGNLLCSSKQF